MFDELAERSLSESLGRAKHTYVRLAIIFYCQILALHSRRKLFYIFKVTIIIVFHTLSHRIKLSTHEHAVRTETWKDLLT